jgi:acetoin utilization deacetylase AcuC-like enzyme
MKIIFHERYYNSDYSRDPAADPGRLQSIMAVIEHHGDAYEIVKPAPASREDILRVHRESYLETVESNPLLYELSSLAAGGAIRAAEEAYDGHPAFAVIRPPGHHASGGAAWGFCFFNNMSISLLKLVAEGKINSAFVLDFDLHTGDGNINILENRSDGFEVTILNPEAHSRSEYLIEVESFMQRLNDIDIFAASAGFDQGINDWGGLLVADDYNNLGRLMKEHSVRLCQGRRYAIFEGGYYHPDLGKHVHAFCQGFR